MSVKKVLYNKLIMFNIVISVVILWKYFGNSFFLKWIILYVLIFSKIFVWSIIIVGCVFMCILII